MRRLDYSLQSKGLIATYRVIVYGETKVYDDASILESPVGGRVVVAAVRLVVDEGISGAVRAAEGTCTLALELAERDGGVDGGVVNLGRVGDVLRDVLDGVVVLGLVGLPLDDRLDLCRASIQHASVCSCVGYVRLDATHPQRCAC